MTERLTREDVQAMIDAAITKERERLIKAINYARVMSDNHDVTDAMRRLSQEVELT